MVKSQKPATVNKKTMGTPTQEEINSANQLTENLKEEVDEKQEKANLAYNLAEDLMGKYHFKATTDNQELFVYYPDNLSNQDEVGGMYRNKGDLVVQQIAQAEWGAHTNTTQIKEAQNIITRYNFVNRSQFDSNPNIINVKNGLLNLNTLELEPHSPDFLSIRQFPIVYDPKSDCPQIKKYLHEVLRPQDFLEVVKFLGYLLINDYRYHKILVLVGPTHSGKTRFILLVYKFLGGKSRGSENPLEPDPNISTLTLQDLDRDKSSSSELFGKIANIADDMPSVSIREAGMIKGLTGESPVRARRVYERGFSFVNTAKFIFACNHLPYCKMADDAYYGRFLIIPFNKVFLPGQGADPTLINKMTTGKEMSGLLNLAIEGRKLLLKENKLGSLNIDEIKEQYSYWQDEKKSSIRFVNDMIVIDNALDGVIKGDIYNSYISYCERKGLIARSESSFFRDINSKLSIDERTSHPWRLNKETNMRERAWVVKGIRLKTAEQADEDGVFG